MKNATAIPNRATTNPSRMPRASARSPIGSRSSNTATIIVATQSSTIAEPMMVHNTPSRTVVVLKWLCRPRTTCPTMITISITPVTTTTLPNPLPSRRRRPSREIIQASVVPNSANDTANFSGLSQIGAPTNSRSSTTRPASATGISTALATANTISGRCQPSSGRSPIGSRLDVVSDMDCSDMDCSALLVIDLTSARSVVGF